jgi:two-component system, NtrC family, nitrogen regulation response regulator GlnG
MHERDLRLVVVDDDDSWRGLLETWLDREGCRAIMIARAEWVLQAIDQHHPDVVVLDVELPGGNGLDVLASLRRRWPSLPVIVMTAFGNAVVADRARRLRADAYLEKPFRLAALVAEIRRVGRPGGPDGTGQGAGRSE